MYIFHNDLEGGNFHRINLLIQNLLKQMSNIYFHQDYIL